MAFRQNVQPTPSDARPNEPAAKNGWFEVCVVVPEVCDEVSVDDA